MARGAGWFVAAFAAALIGAPAALAEGGQTISGAPAIAPGQQEFGNTSNGSKDSDGAYHSYWALGVTAGDHVTIDWEGQFDSDGRGPGLVVFPVGTTDFNVGNTDPTEAQTLDPNSRNELTFTALRTGTMPTEFLADTCDYFDFDCTGDPGPYDFTVHILHDVRLSLPALSALPLTGSVQVGAHNPDGVALSDPGLIVYLQIKLAHGNWENIGSAPASAGVATIPYAAPPTVAGQRVSLRAISAGANYLSEATASEKVLVGEAPPPPPGPVQHRHKHKRRHHHHHHHHRHHHRHRG